MTLGAKILEVVYDPAPIAEAATSQLSNAPHPKRVALQIVLFALFRVGPFLTKHSSLICMLRLNLT